MSKLRISEAWIKKKINLRHDNFDDIKSLALPGSYEEKISELGNSLEGFSRLKSLDLSKNVLTSLDGLKHLELLETLNLYYNKINSLKELSLLHHNKNLKEVDLRLNPVTKSEPDYRLFLIHLLPQLKILDDRNVRDSERRAALSHFTVDQAYELDYSHETVDEKDAHPKKDLPRTELIHRFKRPSVLEDDDSDVMDLIVGSSRQLKPDRNGKSQIPVVDMYSKLELKELSQGTEEGHELKGKPLSSFKTEKQKPPWKGVQPAKYYSTVSIPRLTANPQNESIENEEDATSCKDAPSIGDKVHHPDSLNGWSEQAQPKSAGYHAVVDQKHYARDYVYPTTSHTTENHVQNTPEDLIEIKHLNDITTEYEPDLFELLERFTSLVDKHWNGPNSLKANRKFQDITLRLLASYLSQEGRILKSEKTKENALHQKIRDMEDKLQVKNEKLQEKDDLLKDLQKKTSDVIEHYQIEMQRTQTELQVQSQELASVKDMLEKAERKIQTQEDIQMTLKLADKDLVHLREKLVNLQQSNEALRADKSSLQAENRSLCSQLDAAKAKSQNHVGFHAELEKLEDLCSSLRAEKAQLYDQSQQQLEAFSQLQEVTSMLQESHRALVTTNDHLLQELEEGKERHTIEIRQMSWSYEQLKKTCDLLPKI